MTAIFAQSEPFIDFITWPELGLSVLGVLAVFVGLSGFMLLLATQLAEEGHWISAGVVGPLVFALVSVFMGSPIKVVLLVVALIAMIGTPIALATKRPSDCMRPVATGMGLFLGGGLIVAFVLSMHFTHYVR